MTLRLHEHALISAYLMLLCGELLRGYPAAEMADSAIISSLPLAFDFRRDMLLRARRAAVRDIDDDVMGGRVYAAKSGH